MKNLKSILLIIAIGLAYFFRPWLHGTFMYFYKNPLILEIIFLAGLFLAYELIWVKRKRVKKKKESEEAFYGRLLASSIIPLLFFLLIFSQSISTLIVPLQLSRSLEYNAIDELPQSQENLRLMPMEVAYRYAKDGLQLPQYKLGPENIANTGGSLSWQFPLVPDGTLLSIMIKNKGIVYVDATVQEKNSEMVEKELQIGEGMRVFDNLKWNVFKERYWVDLDDTYYILKDGEIYTVVPTISYDWKIYYGLLYTLPVFDGVIVLDPNGEISHLSPEEAAASDLFEDERIFPENLARTYAESYAFKDGIINYFFIHEDQIEIQDISGNPQPFLIDTPEGLKWFISAEPYGESHGIFKIFVIDAKSGKIELFELTSNSTLTGPVKATEFVRKNNPQVDWTQFKIVEPIPLVRDSKLYWKVAVIPYGAAGIAYQAFIDADTNDVFEARTAEEIEAFIKGEEFVEDGGESTDETGEKPTEASEIIKQINEKLAEIEDLLEELE